MNTMIDGLRNDERFLTMIDYPPDYRTTMPPISQGKCVKWQM
jgi:hypothetical protein